MSPAEEKRPRGGVLRSLGLGLITGAADDDPSAIGTYASAGAKWGPSFLWLAPFTFPMMVTVIYLSSKLGQVAGKGLFDVIRERYPRCVVYPALFGIVVGNTIEAAADIGGMAAAIHLLVPVSTVWIVVPVTFAILALQFWGSYQLIRSVFRWLAFALLTYVGAAILAKPDLGQVLRGTFIPTVHLTREFLPFLVAVIGTTLSAYLYTWQSNAEVEEEIAIGRRSVEARQGATRSELAKSRWDTIIGMFFSSVVIYFIILSTAATLFPAGKTELSSAADAAEALRPLAGPAAGALFAIGLIGAGFLAVPVMTTGAAYDLSQTFGWRHGLHAKPTQAKRFYAVIFVLSMIAMGLNFAGVNPMKALVWAGIVQGFSTPPMLLIVMRLTNNREVMGRRVNSRALNVLGWTTTVAVFAATLGLVAMWLI